MNLREHYGTSFSLIGDPEQKKIQRGEMLAFLNQGQNVVAGALWNVEREMFATDSGSTIPAVIGTATYLMPADVREIIRVSYGGTECTRIATRSLSALDRSTWHRGQKGYQQWYSETAGSLGRFKIELYPTPTTTEVIKVWYYRKPTDFHELGTYNGTVTTGSAANTFTDTGAPFRGTTGTGLDTFWVDATVKFTKGANIGQKKRVISWVANTGVFTTEAFTDTPSHANADTFELDQVSIVPDQFHHLISFYASYLAASKLGMQSPWMEQFQLEMQMMRAKWQDNLDANLPGDVRLGVSETRAQVRVGN